MPRGDQLIRQWTLIRLLTGRIGRTLAQLASELGVTKRTVQRDLEVLTTAGFPVTSDMRNGTVFWHFMEGFHAEMPIALTLTEQMALYFSKGLFLPLQGTPMYESLESAMQKIGSQLPAQSFQFLRGLDQGISVSSFGLKDYSQSKEVIEVLTRAVFQRLTVRILHRAVHHEHAIEREVNPYKLWYVNNGLYVVGHDQREDALRTFAVERIQWVKLTNRRFEIPPDFNFEKFKQTAFNMIWGEPQEVKIRFSPSQAPYIRERTWHPSQKIEICLERQKSGVRSQNVEHLIRAFCLLCVSWFALSAHRLGFPARSRRGGACDHIPPFPGHHLASNGIDRGGIESSHQCGQRRAGPSLVAAIFRPRSAKR